MVKKLATVIGGNGFIGRNLMIRLKDEGWDCWVPDRNHTWPDSDRTLGTVFYCAGFTADYANRPALTLEAHVTLLARVLQSQSYKTLVYLSSTRVYDSIASNASTDEDILLNVSPHLPRHLYDLTKLTGECMCYSLSQNRAKIVRLSCVYSLKTSEDGFLSTLINKVSQFSTNSPLLIDSSPQTARDYVHIDDVTRALIQIAEESNNYTYNVASGENIKNHEIAKILYDYTGKKIQFNSDREATNPPRINISRFKEEFKWQPQLVNKNIDSRLKSFQQKFNENHKY